MEHCDISTPRRAFLVSTDGELEVALAQLWPKGSIHWSAFATAESALEHLFTDPPDLFVIDQRSQGMSAQELVALVKGENVYRQVPVVLCVPEDALDSDLDWRILEADDFLLIPLNLREAEARLTLCLCRATRSLDANPLTRLPGNTTIIQRIQESIDREEEFALVYTDLDHFKSFNDKYGFVRGDEVLMMTARIIVNSLRECVGQGGFVGHVGGDDFVFMLDELQAVPVCERIIQGFDAIVPNFYDPKDKDRGFIISTNRTGAEERFPLMTISMAVVHNKGAHMKHYGQASAIASALKKAAKAMPGSSYATDRRYYEQAP